MGKITRTFLKQNNVCTMGYKFWIIKCEGLEDELQLRILAAEKMSWFNWLLIKLMKYKQYVAYAVFAAEQIIEFNDNKINRETLAAAKKCIKASTIKNRQKAEYASSIAFEIFLESRDEYIPTLVSCAIANTAAAANLEVNSAAVAATQASIVSSQIKNRIVNYGLELIGENKLCHMQQQKNNGKQLISMNDIVSQVTGKSTRLF